jgi:hypothetical protein
LLSEKKPDCALSTGTWTPSKPNVTPKRKERQGCKGENIYEFYVCEKIYRNLGVLGADKKYVVILTTIVVILATTDYEQNN